MPQTSTAVRKHTAAQRTLVLLAAALMLILTACGTTKMGTSIKITSPGSGSRTMTITFTKVTSSDALKGGVEAAENSVKNHLPEELSYNGLTRDGENAQLSFTLDFSSPQDYRQKIASLLSRSGSNITPDIKLTATRDTLVPGIQFEENFTSKDLMGWLPKGLVEDKVISSSNASKVLGNVGATTVTYNGSEVKNSSSDKVKVSDVKDYGFHYVLIRTAVNNDGTYTTSVLLRAREPMKTEQRTAVDTYLAQHVPTGAEVRRGAEASAFAEITKLSSRSDSSEEENMGRTISFISRSMDELNEDLGAIFGRSLSLQRETRAQVTENGVQLTEEFTGRMDCSLLCSPQGQGGYLQLRDAQAAPNTFYSGTKDNVSNASSRISRDLKLSYEHSLVAQSTAVDVTVGLNNSVQARFDYGFATADIATASEQLAAFLRAPDQSNSTLSVREENGTTIYSVTMNAASVSEFESALQAYLPGSQFSIADREGYHPFGSTYSVSSLFALEHKVGSNYSGSFEARVNLPALSAIPAQQSVKDGTEISAGDNSVRIYRTQGLAQAQQINLQARGMNLLSVIIDAALLLSLIAAVWVLIARRGKLQQRHRAIRARREAYLAAHAPVPGGTEDTHRAPAENPEPATAVLAAGSFGALYGANTSLAREVMDSAPAAESQEQGLDATRVLPEVPAPATPADSAPSTENLEATRVLPETLAMPLPASFETQGQDIQEAGENDETIAFTTRVLPQIPEPLNPDKAEDSAIQEQGEESAEGSEEDNTIEVENAEPRGENDA